MRNRFFGFQKKSVLSGLIVFAAFVVGTMQSNAQTIWDGGGPDANWSDALNWNNDIAPTYPQALTFDGTANLTTVNDNTGITVNGITFNPTAGAFFLNNNAITLGGDIVNNSANLQTINLATTLNATPASFNFNGGSGGLTVNGNLTGAAAGAAMQQVDLIGNASINGVLSSGAGGATAGLRLNVTNASSDTLGLTLGGNNTSSFGGQLFVSRGVMNFGSATEAPNMTITRVTGGNIGEFITVANNLTGTGTFNMNNGSLTLNDGQNNTGTTSVRLAMGNVAAATGNAETAIFNQTGGTITFQGFNVGSSCGIFGANQAGVTSAFNLSGGTFDAGNAAFNVAARGVGSLNISGTAVVKSIGSGNNPSAAGLGITINDDRMVAGNLQSIGTLNLNAGGTLQATSIRMTSNRGGQAVNANMNFNGGTWMFNSDNAHLFAAGTNGTATVSGANYVGNDILKANVQAGGAIIDKNGHTGIIDMPLLHDAGLGGTADGGLDVKGSGTLTLSGGINTYTGGTTVEAGTLVIASGSDLANSVSVTLSAINATTLTLGSATSLNSTLALSLFTGDTLNLNFSGADTIGSLLMDGTPEAAGTYNAAQLAALDSNITFNGTGLLTIASVPEPASWAIMGLGALLFAGLRRSKTAK
jgi:autotransporter-associated beta strand protein